MLLKLHKFPCYTFYVKKILQKLHKLNIEILHKQWLTDDLLNQMTSSIKKVKIDNNLDHRSISINNSVKVLGQIYGRDVLITYHYNFDQVFLYNNHMTIPWWSRMRLRKPYKYYVLNPLLRNAVKWSDTTFYDIAK